MIKKINEFTDKEKFSFKGLLILLLIAVVYLVTPQIVGSLVYKNLQFSENISLVIGNIVAFLILLILFFPMLKTKFKEYISNSENFYFSLKCWGIGLGIMMISNLILNFVVFPGEIAENEELNRQFLLNYKSIALIEIVVIAPFLEEMVFRFGLRKFFGKNKYFPLFTAIIFGALHALTGISSMSDMIYLLYTIPYGALGYAFGHLYNTTDNIFSSMSMHMLHNFMTYMIVIMAV